VIFTMLFPSWFAVVGWARVSSGEWQDEMRSHPIHCHLNDGEIDDFGTGLTYS